LLLLGLGITCYHLFKLLIDGNSSSFFELFLILK
jgi:hypothetical protein